jgi:hypothetical protein
MIFTAYFGRLIVFRGEESAMHSTIPEFPTQTSNGNNPTWDQLHLLLIVATQLAL